MTIKLLRDKGVSVQCQGAEMGQAAEILRRITGTEPPAENDRAMQMLRWGFNDGRVVNFCNEVGV